MKLIVAGATGFVGREVIRQSLIRPDITSVVALSRTPISPSPQSEDGAAGVSKLRNIIIKDYGDLSDNVKKEFAGADACIWTVAITVSKAKGLPVDEVTRVCQENTLTGLKTMHDAGVNRPFRFVYMSGVAAERDQTKTPSYAPEYSLMRGETENKLLAVAAQSKGELDVCVAKPGWITDATFSRRSLMGFALKWVASLPSVSVVEVSAAMLDQVVKGFEKEPLMSDDLLRIGRQVLDAPQ